MSQEKVDAYKKEKANRKKALEDKKKKDLTYKIIGGLVTVVMAVWVVASIGWSYLGWDNPFVAETTKKVYSAGELASIRDKLGLDSEGKPKEEETTTKSGSTETTTAKENSSKEETTTKAETNEEATTKAN